MCYYIYLYIQIHIHIYIYRVWLVVQTKKHQPTGFFETAHYGLGSNQHLAHLDPIAGAVLAVGGGKMQQVRSILCQQRVAGEVGTKTTCTRAVQHSESCYSQHTIYETLMQRGVELCHLQ